MTTRRDSLLMPQPVPTYSSPILVDVEGAYVPGLLALLESRKYSASWADGEPYSTGAEYYTKLQWELLMDASDRIISEVRQVRGPKPGQDPSESFDPTITPQYNGSSIFDAVYNSQSGLEGVNEKAAQILTAVQQLAAESNGAKLDEIIAILAVL